MVLIGLKREGNSTDKDAGWYWTFEGLDDRLKRSLKTPMVGGDDSGGWEQIDNDGLWDRRPSHNQPNAGSEYLGAILFAWKPPQGISYLFDIPNRVNQSEKSSQPYIWYGYAICQYGQQFVSSFSVFIIIGDRGWPLSSDLLIVIIALWHSTWQFYLHTDLPPTKNPTAPACLFSTMKITFNWTIGERWDVSGSGLGRCAIVFCRQRWRLFNLRMDGYGPNFSLLSHFTYKFWKNVSKLCVALLAGSRCNLQLSVGDPLPTTDGVYVDPETMYYYDYNSNECTDFPYLGANGNANRFSTKDECKAVCIGGSPECIYRICSNRTPGGSIVS